jgi:lipoate-protein ligase B
VRAGARKDYIGVWVSSPGAPGGAAAFPAARAAAETDEAKIAAIGLSVSRGVTKHGFALNVNTNMEHFRWIVPCGIRTKPVTSLQKILRREVPLEEVKRRVEADIREVFAYDA